MYVYLQSAKSPATKEKYFGTPTNAPTIHDAAPEPIRPPQRFRLCTALNWSVNLICLQTTPWSPPRTRSRIRSAVWFLWGFRRLCKSLDGRAAKDRHTFRPRRTTSNIWACRRVVWRFLYRKLRKVRREVQSHYCNLWLLIKKMCVCFFFFCRKTSFLPDIISAMRESRKASDQHLQKAKQFCGLYVFGFRWTKKAPKHRDARTFRRRRTC